MESVTYREIEPGDIPALFAVRAAVRENGYTREELRQLGITEASVRAMLGTSHRGWLCEDASGVVGFAMGDARTGELWVIAVLPSHEGRGVGAGVLQLTEDWLFSLGWQELWLTTAVPTGLRAYGFYRRAGWRDDLVKGGLRHMRKPRPA